jgi:hypothetical protein
MNPTLLSRQHKAASALPARSQQLLCALFVIMVCCHGRQQCINILTQLCQAVRQHLNLGLLLTCNGYPDRADKTAADYP